MVTPATREKIQRDLDHFDRAPEPIRRLINEYGVITVIKAMHACGADQYASMRKFLERNRVLSQEELLEEAALTDEDVASFNAAIRSTRRRPI